MAGKIGTEGPILIKFAQKLAGNEKKHRTAAMKKLRKWLTARSQTLHGGLSRDDLIKIWKGLHYCMWMSDKPLVQEELAGTMSDLINCFPHFPQALLFVDTFFETECREWFGIDYLRLDKFMMLIRQMFRRLLNLLKSHKWKKSYIRQVTSVLEKHIITAAWNDNIPDGIRFHMADIYLEELDRADPEMSTDRVHMFLEPYCEVLTKMKINTLFRHIIKRVFIELINWEVEKAEIIEYNNQLKMNTAAVNDDEEGSQENGDDSGDDMKEQEIPKHIKVNYKRLADRLFELASDASCPGKNRTSMYGLVKRFSDLADGKLPKRLTYDDIKDERGITPKDIRRAAHELMELEIRLEKETSKALRKKLKKLKRKRAGKQRSSTEEGQTKGENGDGGGGDSYYSHEEKDDDGDDDDDDDDVTPSPKKRRNSRMDDVSVEKTKTEDTISHEYENITSKGVNASSIRKVKKKKKEARKEQADILSSSCDEDVSEDTVSACKGEQNVKSKQKKKHRKEEASFLEFTSKVDIYEQTEQNSADSASPTCNTPVRKTHLLHSSEGSDSKTMDAVNTLSEGKHDKKLVKKGRSDTAILDTSGLGSDESLLCTRGLVSEGDDEVGLSSGEGAGAGAKTSSEDFSTPSTASRHNTEDDLVSFIKVKRSPPAFVKRAIKKVATPKTEPKKPSAELVNDVAPGSSPSLSKKKVVFAMNKNKAQDFSESLMVSPVLPFNPKQKPDQGILRSSPTATESPVVKSPRTKLFMKRVKAADFF